MACSPQDSGASSLGEALAWGASRLADAGVEAPRREARLLAAHCLGLPASSLLDPARMLDRQAYAALVARRAGREPMAFITGRAGFWTLELEVSPATLVPRADSETLIEAALAARPDRQRVRRILDLGTGTGCLLLAALTEFPAAEGLGIDLSWEAARLAARNGRANGLAGRAFFVAGDWAASVSGRFDLILCNPPYIPQAELAGLMPEVAGYEPARALDGGPDGLDAYATLIAMLPQMLAQGGAAVFELGVGQADAVAALAAQAGLTHVATRPDLGGIARAIVLRHADVGEKAFGSGRADS